jgi:glycerol kinase
MRSPMGDKQSPPTDPIVIAIDQGTGSTKALAIDARGIILAQTARSVSQHHPRPGWVEQDAAEILASVRDAITGVADALGPQASSRVVGLGLSTQRESAVIWDRETGEALGPVLGWQDRRTRPMAETLIDAGYTERVRAISGLPIDPMFSALKFQWLLDRVDPDRSRSRRGQIGLGTVDAWLMFSLSGEFSIEAGNASRTQLMDLASLTWSDELLALFDIPAEALPVIVASQRLSPPLRDMPFGGVTRFGAVIADSHAALYAHGARARGEVKVTYGTGSSIMGLSNAEAVPEGLVKTVAWMTEAPQYAYEGNILATGATLVWVASLFEVSTEELCALAESAPVDAAIDIVPAFAGLGAPWWDENAQGILSGLTLGTDRAAIARAATDSIVLQIEDVLATVDDHVEVLRVYVDGGPTSNDWLMRVQADLSQREIIRSDVAELSALGAAQMAGVRLGAWTEADVRVMPRPRTHFNPTSEPEGVAARVQNWRIAVLRARGLPVPHLERTS